MKKYLNACACACAFAKFICVADVDVMCVCVFFMYMLCVDGEPVYASYSFSSFSSARM